MTRLLCKQLWAFLFIFVPSIVFMYVVRNWDFCFLFMALGFVVGREDRIKRKLEAWSKLVEEFNRKLVVIRTRRGAWLCPRWFSKDFENKERPRPEKGYLGRLKCKVCGHKFRREKLPTGVESSTRIVNTAVRFAVCGTPTDYTASAVPCTARDFEFFTRYSYDLSVCLNKELPAI